jgi:hypothetical protein
MLDLDFGKAGLLQQLGQLAHGIGVDARLVPSCRLVALELISTCS